MAQDVLSGEHDNQDPLLLLDQDCKGITGSFFLGKQKEVDLTIEVQY